MRTIEFYTNIQGRVIEIPREYCDALKHASRARVVLLIESPSNRPPNLIDQLLARPLQSPDFHPLSRDAIYAR